jgi:hypothetical protein
MKERAMTSYSDISIRSTLLATPKVRLRMDGTGITSWQAFGGGTVNVQFDQGGYEKFRLEDKGGGTFAIASMDFPNVYLRMNGGSVNAGATIGGTVNCQCGAGAWETFRLEHQPDDGTYAIESFAIPSVYLRLDGAGLTAPTPSGGGIVNCRFTVGAKTRFVLECLP